MNSCPACQGYTELKPCGSYCINVMKGCLVWHIELQKLWDQYLEALSQLTERLQKPYNLGEEIVLHNVENEEFFCLRCDFYNFKETLNFY